MIRLFYTFLFLLLLAVVNQKRLQKWVRLRAQVKQAQAAIDSIERSPTSTVALLAEATSIWQTSLCNENMALTGLWQLTLSLSVTLWVRYKVHGEEEHLDLAISVGRHALSLQFPGRVNRGVALGNLGIALYDKYELCNESKLLDDAIELLREAVTLRPPGHPQRGDVLNNFSQALITRYKALHDPVDLNEAIDCTKNALDANPKMSPGHRISTRNMAILQMQKFEAENDVSSLEKSITSFEETLLLSPPGHPDRAESLVNLAGAYETQNTYTGEAIRLEYAVDCAREALKLRPLPNPKRYLAMVTLGTCLLNYAHIFTDQLQLAESAAMLEDAISLIPDSDCDCRFRALSNLALACEFKYKQTSNLNLLEDGIRYGEQSLELPSRPTWQITFAKIGLAQRLFTFYLHTNELTALYNSIELSEHALLAIEQSNAQFLRSKHAALLNLSNALCSRFILTRNNLDLNLAVRYAEEALLLTPPNHPQHATSLRALGNVLHEDFRSSGNKTSAARFVSCAQEATKLCPPDHHHHISSIYTLAIALIDSYTATGNATDIEDAIKHLQYILNLYPEGYANRCDILKLLSGLHLGKDSSHFDPVVALGYALAAVSDIHASLRQRLLIGRDILSFVKQNELDVVNGSISEDLGEMILKLYQRTIDLLPLVANYALDLPSRLKELADCESLGTNAAAFALRLGQSRLAIEMLENARGIFWAQALRLRDPGLDNVPTLLADELRTLLHTLDRDTMQAFGQAHHEELHDKALSRRRQLSYRAEEIINMIRHLPGLERYLLGPTFASLSLAASEGPIVVLIADTDGCNAVVLGATSDPTVIPLSGLSISDLHQMSLCVRETQARGIRGFGVESSDTSRLFMGISQQQRRKPMDRTELILADIWHKIVKPVVDALELKQAEHFDRPCIRWCPTGGFTFVPLHAAGLYSNTNNGQVSSKYFVSSYVPTISSTLRASTILKDISPTSIRALLVAEPTPSGLQPLLNVQEEVQLVDQMLAQAAARTSEHNVTTLQGAHVQQVKSELSQANILHLACHGLQHPTNPLQSGFYLRDGCLTISDIMQLNITRPTFAFLSACETAKGDINQPDQFIHLAASILFAGFRSVVATMWTMDDADGPAVARTIYEDLLQNETIDVRRVPYALDKAVAMLREQLPAARWATFIHIGA